MSKKNTRKRLLAGALSAIMMLTMCPTWALADDDGIATLPLVDESRPVADFAPVVADPIETPDVPSSSEPEVQEPANENPSAGQDIEESGNNSNDPASDASEDNSQNNNAADSTPDVNDQPQDAANEVSTHWGNNGGAQDWQVATDLTAEYWITNARATDADNVNTLTISSDTDGITDDDGIAVEKLAPKTRSNIIGYEITVFGHARVLASYEHQEEYQADRSTSGTEIDAIRFNNNKFQYRNKATSSWTPFSGNYQLVFYYLVRTNYSKMVQIDVSDWAVDTEPSYDNRRSVTYQVYVKNADGSYTLTDDRKFWYNKTFTVSSVLVRQADADHYTIDSVELDPQTLGEVNGINDEYQFSLNLSEAGTDNATVKIYVSAKKNVQPHKLRYVLNGGEITTAAGKYTAAGDVYPDATITTPEAAKDNCTFDGWYTDAGFTHKWEGTTMPNEDLTLYAKFTAKGTPTQPEQPTETKTDAMYFVLLPNRGVPKSNADQGEANYLPSSKSDGGVSGLDQSTGYVGSLTKEGKDALDETTGSITDIESGVSKSYLNVPSDLGFFTPDNWSGSTYKDGTVDPTTILGKDFNVNNIRIVWYTIKDQRDGIHVDGYVAGVPVTVTYHPNYGTIPGMSADDHVVNATSGDTHTVLENMFTVPEGYVFGGWYAEGTQYEVGSDHLLMTDLHLYAKWVKNVFKVSYEVDGDPFGTPESKNFRDTVQIKAAPTKEGHTFSGWTPAADVASIIDVVDGKFTMPAQDVRFDAQFNINKYNVIYKVDGAVDSTEEHTYGSDVTIKDVPTKTGYTFTGWKIGDKTAEDFNMPAHDVVIEGTFEANDYTVTYKVDGEIYTINDAKQVFTYHYGDKVQLLKNASKEGHTFSGWTILNTVKPFGTGGGFYMPAENVVIEGTFTAVPAAKHRVNYYVDGVYYASEEYETGANVTIKADLAKVGYTFSGWKIGNDDAADFTMPDNDVDIHGSYSQNKYSYTINKHFYDEKGAEIAELASTATASGAENILIADLYKADAANQTVNEKNYVYVSAKTTVEPALNKLTENVTIDLHYYLDVKGGKTDPDNKGDDIPDAWEYRLTFKVVNGEWNNGGSADIVVYVPFKDKNGKELESVIVPATSIPAVGEKPAEGFVAGAWDKTPVGGDKVVSDTVFTYTYAKKTDPTTPDDSGNSGSSSGGHSHRRNPTVIIPDEVPTGLNGDDHYAYIVGYPDATVRPQNGITRAEVATIFFRLLDDETREANSTKSNSYSDVAAGSWYNHAISTLSAMGIVKGDTKGKFNPNASITRAEFAAIAARFDDNANTSAASFSDIANHWAKDEISAAANNGWITGYTDGTFRPNNRITRAEAMTLVNRVLKRLPETDEDLHEDMITWSDNSDASQWYYLDVQEATNSHYYDVKENQYEKWTDLRETRDWTELEK